MSWVAILMGSQSDWPVMESTTEVLGELGIEFEVRVSSAHRTPRETAAYVVDAETRGCNVFICGAGLACPAGICSFIKPISFFGGIVYFSFSTCK